MLMAKRPGGAGRSWSPQRCGPDSEPQRRAKVHRLPINPGVHRCRGTHLQLWRGPGSPGASGLSPGASRTMIPRWPPLSVGRVPRNNGRSSA